MYVCMQVSLEPSEIKAEVLSRINNLKIMHPVQIKAQLKLQNIQSEHNCLFLEEISYMFPLKPTQL